MTRLFSLVMLSRAFVSNCLSVLLVLSFTLSNARAETYEVATTTVSDYATAAFKHLEYFYNQLGHELNMVLEPNARSLKSVNAGKYDSELARVAGMEITLPNLIPLGEPYMVQNLIIAYHRDETEIPQTLEHLIELMEKGASVAFPLGNKFLTKSLGPKGGYAVSDNTTLLKLISRKRVRYSASFLGVMEQHADMFTDVIVGLDQPLLVIPMYHYLHIRNTNLRLPLTLAIKQYNVGNGHVPSMLELKRRYNSE
ncbi:hypothetical protein [Kiloniella antarctica]|uniref:Solute-binding protein family 3/N-terminal domain-containing protein n=1 Tax=Kiloniella antarctica TaxID=1550907 RepID=A0ABW5BL58_9PROT